MLTFAIVGPETQNTFDLREAAIAAGHGADIFTLKEVRFEAHGKTCAAFYKDKNIGDFDIVIFRGYNLRIAQAQMLAHMLVAKNKTIIEESLAGTYVRGKMQQAQKFAEHGIRHPTTFQASDSEGWKNILEKMEYPIIAKPIFGRKGRGIEKLDSQQKASAFFSQNPEDYLVQEYFPIKSDYRVFVVGNTIVGGFQRFMNDGEYKSNIHGTRAEKIGVDEGMARIALAATRAVGYEIAGVDLFMHAGKTYVIEVNVAPQWEKFKLITDINPAQEIIRYAIAKHLKNYSDSF
jgi:RimK family alpha-L-glutamate ligase